MARRFPLPIIAGAPLTTKKKEKYARRCFRRCQREGVGGEVAWNEKIVLASALYETGLCHFRVLGFSALEEHNVSVRLL